MKPPPQASPLGASPHVRDRRVEARPGLVLRVIEHQATTQAPDHSGDHSGMSQPPAVLMVHGLSSNALMWTGVGGALAAAGVASLAVDQRGHGLSDKPDGPYDMVTVTDDLAHLLANLRIERPVLLGQSWGANVVMEYAARFPDQVAGVVPVDGGFIDLASTFSSWDECAEALAPPRLAGTPASRIRSMLRASHPDWSELAIDSMMGFVAVDSDGLAAPHLSFENHLRVLRGMWDHRPLERYRAITAPVWWIVAEPGAGAQNWAARKRPALEAVERFLPASRSTWMVGDHDLHAQHPQQVAQIVLDALSSGYFS